jgi:hypothetical protein
MDSTVLAWGTVSALPWDMPLRTFLSREGSTWSVWRIESGSAAVVPGTPTEWLCFQDAEGEERRRLFDFPANWDELTDDRLDLLRKMAEPVKLWQRPSPPGGVPRMEQPKGTDRNE